jgi:hypothetical protein
VPTLKEIVEPILGIFTAVPGEGEGVCAVCHGAPNAGYRLCYSCHETTHQVTQPVHLVVPISLSRVGEQLHYVLRSYKNVPGPDLRWRFRAQVAATLGVGFRNSVEFDFGPQRCHCAHRSGRKDLRPSNACSNPGGTHRHVAAPGGLKPRTR